MYPVMRARNRVKVIEQKEFVLGCNDVTEYLTFPKLSSKDCIEHMFTTRIGGVSEGDCATLNFSFSRGDNPEHVLENYRRMGEVFGVKPHAFVATDQTHTTNIHVVDAKDAGKGVTRERDYSDIDGLITSQKGLVLSCFFADCVPLYFVDAKREVIGLAHSGWRGTVDAMGACMVKRMQESFGCEPQDIVAAIGPSICQDCYEISEEVVIRFREGFWRETRVGDFCEEAFDLGLHPTGNLLINGKEAGKYQLDLWLANYVVLRSAGVLAENIDMTDICTNCNPQYLFSHRATNGKRGNLAAFLMLRESK